MKKVVSDLVSSILGRSVVDLGGTVLGTTSTVSYLFDLGEVDHESAWSAGGTFYATFGFSESSEGQVNALLSGTTIIGVPGSLLRPTAGSGALRFIGIVTFSADNDGWAVSGESTFESPPSA